MQGTLLRGIGCVKRRLFHPEPPLRRRCLAGGWAVRGANHDRRHRQHHGRIGSLVVAARIAEPCGPIRDRRSIDEDDLASLDMFDCDGGVEQRAERRARHCL